MILLLLALCVPLLLDNGIGVGSDSKNADRSGRGSGKRESATAYSKRMDLGAVGNFQIGRAHV